MVGDFAPGQQPPLDAELRRDALDVLRDATAWTLPDTRWSSITDIVRTLSGAWRAGDRALLRESVYELELAGPVRATPIGTRTLLVAAPEPVREEINELILVLDDEVG